MFGKTKFENPFLPFFVKVVVWSSIPVLAWFLTNLVWDINKAVEIAVYAFITTLFGVVVISLALGPLIAPHLVTTTTSQKHVWFLPLFSDLENGRAKAVVDTGNDLRRHIMNYNDADFARTGDVHSDNHWLVKSGKGNVLNARNWWEEYIERTTGLVFVGLYPFRKILHRPITLRNIRIKDGKSALTVVPGRTKENPQGGVTDHVRVREFDWGVQATTVAKGFYRIRMLCFVRCRCTNPNKTLFGVDNWADSFSGALEARIIEIAQGKTLEELMNKESAMEVFAERIKQISADIPPKTEDAWGLEILQVRIVDYDLSQLEPVEKKALTAVEVARRNREAKILEYDAEAAGQAKVVAARAQQIEKYGTNGLAASQHEALETAAKDGAVTIVTSFGSPTNMESDNLLKSLLTANAAPDKKKEVAQ